MENIGIFEIKKSIEYIKYNLKQTLNNKSFKEKNTKLSNNNNYNNELYLNYIFKKLENLFQILKKNMQKNKLIFEKIKMFLCVKKENNSQNLRNTIFPFDLKKEIFIDKLKTNKKKEEYYKKCKYIDNYNLRNKLFNKNINYISKTHNNNNSILFYNNSSRYRTNFNLRKINDENQSINLYLNNIDLNTNYFMERTTPFFYNNMNNNNSLLNEKMRNNQNLPVYTKKAYFQNRIIKKEEKRIESFSTYNKEYFGCEDFNTPYIVKYSKNFKPLTKITKNNYKNINNIFLSNNLEDYQMETYNPKKKYNLYSNYLMNNNKINTDRNIYKKNYSLTWRNKNSTTNEINNAKFKEFEINFKNKSQLPFDSLKKNLKKEFIHSKNNNCYIIKDNWKNEIKDKNKLNNKYITYNNIININDPKIIHKDINLIKNYENNIPPKIQSYLIYFKDQKKNLYNEDIIYYRPKSTSKFKGTNKAYNLGNI